MKKVYTRALKGTLTLGVQGEYASLAADVWVAQDDYIIIGWQLKCWPNSAVKTDSHVIGMAELSQAAKANTDGTLGSISMYAEQHTLVAAQAQELLHPGQAYAMLPDGKGISLVEGDHLNLHIAGRVYGADTGSYYLDCTCTVFYVKGRTTQ